MNKMCLLNEYESKFSHAFEAIVHNVSYISVGKQKINDIPNLIVSFNFINMHIQLRSNCLINWSIPSTLITEGV